MVFMPSTYVNMRSEFAKVGKIMYSIVGGRVKGGTFIDRGTIDSRQMDRIVAVPGKDPSSQKISPEPLDITESDIEKARGLCP